MTESIQGYRLSPQQKRSWLLHQRATAYCAQCAIRVEGVLDRDRLRKAIHRVVSRHEILRTAFRRLPGKTTPVQSIGDDVQLTFADAGRIQLDSSEQSREIDSLLKMDRKQAWDFERGPLIRFLLAELSEQSHLLIITLPSICADAASLRSLVIEVSHWYAEGGEEKGRQESEVLQYVQFSEWQLDLLANEGADKPHPQSEKGDVPPDFTLPFEIRSSEKPGFEPDQVELELSARAMSKLECVSSNYGVAMETVLLACWQALLWKLTDNQPLTIGVLFDGRKYKEMKGAIGPYSKWLPIESGFDDKTTFSEILRSTFATAQEAYDSLEYFSIDEGGGILAERLQFPVGFEYEEIPSERTTAATTFSIYKHCALIEPFKVKLRCLHSAGRMKLEMSADGRLFSSESIEVLADEFQTLLENALDLPGKPAATLSVVSPARRHELVVNINATSVAYPAFVAAHGLVERQAAQTPDSIGVEFDGMTLSYGKLDSEANKLAWYLRQLGVGPERVVGICIERNPRMVISMLAILKAGGAYLPLETSLPVERLAFMLEESQAAALVTNESFGGRFEATGVRVIRIDRQERQIEAQQATSPEADVSPDSLAYVIYTSGSTGRPKGVMVPHRGLVNYLLWGKQAYRVEDGEGAPVHSPLGFDLTVTSLWLPLVSGRRVVLVREGKGLETISKALSEGTNYSLIKITPAHLEMLRDKLGGERRNARTIVVGGDALRGESLRPWLKEALGTRLINEYGPTETVVGCSTYEVKEDISGVVPIGKPIWNARMYVLGKEMEVAGVGETGEIYIGGEGLARGYIRRPELTAERFAPDSMSGRPSERLYKTGDAGRYRVDSEMEYLGRNDYQVKVRGYRVELGEIEEVMKEVHGIRAGVVVVRGEGVDRRLVGYVVRDQNKRKEIKEVTEHLRRKLPDYMVPETIVEIGQLPLTANGKIDKNALPPPGSERPGLEREYLAPRTAVEEILAGIWSEVLRIDPVGVHDSFFALGGDSIRTVRVVALSMERGLNYSVEQLFQYQTIAELSRELRIANVAAPPVKSEPFSLVSDEDRLELPDDVEDAYPLTVLQAGMLYHTELTPESPAYHNVNSYHFKARFERDKFEEAVRAIVARHAVLRTSFDLASYSEPLQLVHRTASLLIGVEDLSHLSPSQQDEVVAAFVEKERLRVFDLSRSPLLRFYIHLRSKGTFQFTWIECHAVLDGWSTTSTFAECFTHYFSLLRNQTPQEVPIGATFRDYVLLERRVLESDECRSYWSEKLHGYSPIKLPRWPVPDTAKTGPKMPRLDFPIADEIFEGLKKLALSEAVPFKSVVLAAHLKVMSLLTGKADIVTGIVTSARPEELDGDRVMGLFLNTLPLRARIEPSTWAELVRTAFEAEREFMPYRHYPMGALQKKWGRPPLFEMTFNYLRFHSVEELARSGDLEFLPNCNIESAETSFPLTATFFSSPIGSKLGLIIQHIAAELPEEQVRAIYGRYERVLRSMIANPLARHDLECLLSQDEKNQILVEWNDTNADYDFEQWLHRLVEAQEDRVPDSIVVSFEDSLLSYRELGRRANQLGSHLRRIGIRPDAFIAICMKRSMEMVIAIVGVLKSGGAYVPLDPEYPAERLAFMLNDSGAAMILTHEDVLSEDSEIDGSGRKIIRLDKEWEKIAQESSERHFCEVSPAQAAYMIYTSGSTGRPKGAIVSHRAICNHVLWLQREFGINDEDRMLQRTPVSFDASVLEFYSTLITGGQLVMVRPGGHRDPGYLLDALQKYDVTMLHLIPSMLRLLVEESGLSNCHSLRHVFCGGETLQFDLQSRWLDLSHSELTNLYGPTEGTIVSTFWTSKRSSARFVPIGRPINNVKSYILDRIRAPVPAGVAGELYIGGAGLGRGYHERPGLTAERFVPNHLGEMPGDRLYRTGDLARWLPYGVVDFIGREDNQVKIRGLRIELGEIEAILSSCPGLKQAVAVTREDEVGLRRLVAYVVPENGSGLLASDPRNFLKSKLPESMIPSHFVMLNEMPLTPNGKIDRSALPAPSSSRPDLDRPFAEPLGGIEQAIASVWGQVLNLERVGLYDNFFDLGGDSILMLHVLNKLRDKLARPLTMMELFQYPTVGSLSDLLKQDGVRDERRSSRSDRAEKQREAINRQKEILMSLRRTDG
jgi:amino acid adenylation domain-containing protein